MGGVHSYRRSIEVIGLGLSFAIAAPRSPGAVRGRAASFDGPGSSALVRRLDPSINTHGVGTYKYSSVSSWAARGKAVRLSNELRDLGESCSVGKFVVSRAGEAYDARARGPNREFRFPSC